MTKKVNDAPNVPQGFWLGNPPEPYPVHPVIHADFVDQPDPLVCSGLADSPG